LLWARRVVGRRAPREPGRWEAAVSDWFDPGYRPADRGYRQFGADPAPVGDGWSHTPRHQERPVAVPPAGRRRRGRGPQAALLGGVALLVVAVVGLFVTVLVGAADETRTSRNLADPAWSASGTSGGSADPVSSDASGPATAPTASPTTAPAGPTATPSAAAPGRPATPARTSAGTTAPLPGGNAGYEAQVVTLVNQERGKAGCAALTVDSRLTTAARGHSQDMAARNYFDHNTPEGVTPWTRITNAGYQFSAAAENIAEGQTTPASVMQAWMNSTGHRTNILNCNLRNIGVGLAYNTQHVPYWTQDFGTPAAPPQA
jgi:uncharacterized protein YkwD